MAQLKRTIKNRDIIFDGIHTRDELEKQAFAKLEYLEGLEAELGIEFKDIIQGHRQCFVSNGYGLIFKGFIVDVHVFLKEIEITVEMPNEDGTEIYHPTLTFSTIDKKCINQTRDFEHPIKWALMKEELL